MKCSCPVESKELLSRVRRKRHSGHSPRCIRLLQVLVILGCLALAPFVQAGDSVPSDPLGRGSPQSTVLQFLEACHARQYVKASHYLDMRQWSPEERAKKGPQIAQQLEDLLDDTSFDIATLSRDPEGDVPEGRAPSRERLASFQTDGRTLEVNLEHVELKPGLQVWLVSADSLSVIPTAHQLLKESPFEKRLPQPLVTHEFLDTPLWRWIALLGVGLLIWIVAGLASRGIAVLLGRLTNTNMESLTGPLHLCLAVAGFRSAMALVPPSALPRMYLERALAMGFVLGLAWMCATAVDYIADRWRSRLDPRVKAMTYSVLPLGRQIVKLCLYLIAVLAVVSAWGYNTATILAGLGVGGIAVALAAQKTIENLFGGISVISDRPVLVGDFCRFGTHFGSVIHIGLRSTRVRTLDRTILSVPNGQFSAMELENFSARDKILFHLTLCLRRDTTSRQILGVLSGIRDVLQEHPKVETGSIPVRFIGIGSYSLDVEVFAYVMTSDYDQYLAIQQELLLDLIRAVEHAGTALAVPILEGSRIQELVTSHR